MDQDTHKNSNPERGLEALISWGQQKWERTAQHEDLGQTMGNSPLLPYILYLLLDKMVATSYLWLLSTWNVASN